MGNLIKIKKHHKRARRWLIGIVWNANAVNKQTNKRGGGINYSRLKMSDDEKKK